MSTFDEKMEQLLEQAAVQYIVFKRNEDEKRMEKLHLFAKKFCKKSMSLDLRGIFLLENPV